MLCRLVTSLTTLLATASTLERVLALLATASQHPCALVPVLDAMRSMRSTRPQQVLPKQSKKAQPELCWTVRRTNENYIPAGLRVGHQEIQEPRLDECKRQAATKGKRRRDPGNIFVLAQALTSHCDIAECVSNGK